MSHPQLHQAVGGARRLSVPLSLCLGFLCESDLRDNIYSRGEYQSGRNCNQLEGLCSQVFSKVAAVPAQGRICIRRSPNRECTPVQSLSQWGLKCRHPTSNLPSQCQKLRCAY